LGTKPIKEGDEFAERREAGVQTQTPCAPFLDADNQSGSLQAVNRRLNTA
jgi:hypothetical protein